MSYFRFSTEMSTGKLSLYSDYDTYDSESDYHCRLRAWPSHNQFKKRYRREIKIEISELLVKFGEYSRCAAKLSCKYVSHPITCGLIIYVPYVRPKYKTGSLTLDIERNWELGAKRTNKYNLRQIAPDTVYFRVRNAKLDVSYARMVKKPPILNALVDKEEIWGSRYPQKRYLMNDTIRYQLTLILSAMIEKLRNYFVNTAVSPVLFRDVHCSQCRWLLLALASILRNKNGRPLGHLVRRTEEKLSLIANGNCTINLRD